MIFDLNFKIWFGFYTKNKLKGLYYSCRLQLQCQLELTTECCKLLWKCSVNYVSMERAFLVVVASPFGGVRLKVRGVDEINVINDN